MVKIKLYQWKIWAGILLAQFISFYVFSRTPFFIHFFDQFFEYQKDLHQRLFSRVPFSAGDLFYVILALLFLLILLKIAQRKTRKQGMLMMLVLLNILYFIYNLFWGMLYFQKPVIEKLSAKSKTEHIKELTLKYLELAKETRTWVKEDRNGVFKIDDLKAVEVEILNNQYTLPALLGVKAPTAIQAFKPSLFAPVMSYTGILGYYNPFTAEAQYNPKLPPHELPFTLAHESAHQLGYAREQEANFIGYLIGKKARNPELRYSTEYFVLRSLLNALTTEDEIFVKNVLHQYSPAMKRDRRAAKIFAEKHEGAVENFFGITNDLFLKSNRQDGSITYSYFVDLLLRYETPPK